jgi:hypothetical protein
MFCEFSVLSWIFSGCIKTTDVLLDLWLIYLTYYVGFEVLGAVIMKSSIFLDIISCRPSSGSKNKPSRNPA